MEKKMKRYKLNWCTDILLPNSYECYSKILINSIRDKIKNGWTGLRLGHYTFNNLFKYRIVNTKKGAIYDTAI